MNRLIASHITVAGFVAAVVASWRGLVTFYAADPAAVVAIVAIYGGLSLWFAIAQASAAVREARLSALYPAKVRNIKHRFDFLTEEG